MARLRPVSVPVHTWMVAYDIPDTKRRTRVAKLLGSRGERAQYSVFECRVNAQELQQLRRRVLAIIDAATDHVRWYPLCGPCQGRVVQQGEAAPSDDESFYLV